MKHHHTCTLAEDDQYPTDDNDGINQIEINEPTMGRLVFEEPLISSQFDNES